MLWKYLRSDMRFWGGLIIAVVGMGMAAVTAFDALLAGEIVESGERATAIVERKWEEGEGRDSSRSYYLRLQYVDRDGWLHVVDESVRRPTFRTALAGDRLDLWYDPAHPSRVVLEQERTQRTEAVCHVCVALGVSGAGLLALTVFHAWRRARLLVRGQAALGEVVELTGIRWAPAVRRLRYAFVTADGTRYEGRSRWLPDSLRRSLRTGDPLVVAYDPRRPDRHEPDIFRLLRDRPAAARVRKPADGTTDATPPAGDDEATVALRITLADADRVYAPGEVVRGSFTVYAARDTHCRALTLTRRWKTHGDCDPAAGDQVSQVLFSGAWQAGEEATYPFAVALPGGPFTYHGHRLNLDWFLEVSADLGAGRFVTAETPVLLAAEASGTVRRHRPVVAPSAGAFKPSSDMRDSLRLAAAVIGFLWGIILLGLAAILVGVRYGVPAEALGLGLTGAVGALGVLFRVVRRGMAGRRLGAVDVMLEGQTYSLGTVRTAAPGEELVCTVSFRPRGDVRLERIVARLEAQEEVVTVGSDGKQATLRATVHAHEAVSTPMRDVARGEEVRETVRLPIPADAPYTFTAGQDRLVWTLSLRIEVPGWPDWFHQSAVMVRPEGLPDGSRARPVASA